jgi:hypothetical protein
MPGFFSRHREPVTGMDRREKDHGVRVMCDDVKK